MPAKQQPYQTRLLRLFPRLERWLESRVRPPSYPTPVLLTERLRLRNLEEGDYEALRDLWTREAVTRYLEHRDPYSAEEVRSRLNIDMEANGHTPRITYELAVALRGDEQLVGAVGFRCCAPTRRHGLLGYSIHPDHWGRGYATEAVRALLRFGFEDLGWWTASAGSHPENAASIRVLLKAGLRFRGHNPAFPGAPAGVNACVYSITRSHWRLSERKT